VQPNQVNIHHTPGNGSAYVEYNVYIRTIGNIDIVTQWAPTTGPEPNTITRLRYGVSLNENNASNDTDIQIIHTMPPDFRVVNQGGNW
jgi:hypothetical protein